MPYSIEEHQHRFASWAAGRAASVQRCRFKVWQAHGILEDAGLKEVASCIENLPQADNFDTQHDKWRNNVICAAQEYKDKHGKALEFTHGIAAKLINVYLKSIYVCSGNHEDPRVKAIHPPIDSVLLDTLYNEDEQSIIADKRECWQAARRISWSNLDSEQYQNLIAAIQHAFPVDAGLWQVEKYWQGHQ